MPHPSSFAASRAGITIECHEPLLDSAVQVVVGILKGLGKISDAQAAAFQSAACLGTSDDDSRAQHQKPINNPKPLQGVVWKETPIRGSLRESQFCLSTCSHQAPS